MRDRPIATRLAARSILVIAVLATAATILELGARALGLGDVSRTSTWYAGGNHPQFLFQSDEDAGYVLRRGFAGMEIATSGEFRLPIAVDERGLPVRAQHRENAGGVLAVGDSMTFGEGVSQEETWAARLEQAVGVSVTNGGVPGYSSGQMSARTAQLFPIIRPQLVLMAFFPLWDLWRCDDPLAYRDGFIVIRSFADKLHLANGNLYREVLTGPLGPWSARTLGSSAFLRALMPHLIDRGIAARGKRRPAWSAWAPCLAAIWSTQQMVEDAGAIFQVVIIEGTSAPPPETAEVARRLEEAGIPYLSLDRLMNGRNESRLRFKDGHWNAAGHASVAEVLAPIVSQLLESRAR